MSDTKLRCAKAPCKSCPYRRDVPSGVWAADEYDKLPTYDGTMAEQAMAAAGTKGGGIFMCHQQDGRLCAGWVGCHGATNLLALRIASMNESGPNQIDDSVLTYKSTVPLFATGAQAAAHGKRAMKRPGKRAQRMIERLLLQQVDEPRRRG